MATGRYGFVSEVNPGGFSGISHVCGTLPETRVACPNGVSGTHRKRTHEVDIRVSTGSLVGRRSIKVPLFQLRNGFGLLVEGHGFASQTSITVNPDV
jgi:hypothetical protein